MPVALKFLPPQFAYEEQLYAAGIALVLTVFLASRRIAPYGLIIDSRCFGYRPR